MGVGTGFGLGTEGSVDAALGKVLLLVQVSDRGSTQVSEWTLVQASNRESALALVTVPRLVSMLTPIVLPTKCVVGVRRAAASPWKTDSRVLHPVVMFIVAEGETSHRRNQHCHCLSCVKDASPEVAI